ncbi:MAG TPA: IS5 family transposase [Candidatus Bathyarchaeia archaeon]|nr:IS5 family transposase [Candidatus Bathyarchaeia archaeon]
MRGEDEQQGAVFSYVSAEQRIAADHPLRRIRAMTDAALRLLSGEFDRLYAAGGRPSIAPEKLLRALLLQVLYGRRSERLLMEEMQYNLLFRWFVGLEMDDRVWDVTVFTKNRERLLRGEIAPKFLQAVIGQAGELLSDEHFTVDGTLLEAWASRRSFEKKPDPPERGTGARGRKLLRDTHESKTDPEARLFRRSPAGPARPSYLGHVLTENRYGLVVEACVTQSGTRAEREAALGMLDRLKRRARRITLGADKGYQEEQFISGLRQRGIVPHVAEYAVESRQWPNWLRAEERNDPGFARSQQRRKRVEQVFGWLKHAAGLRQVKLRGRRRVEWMFQLAVAALNLRRLQRLLPAAV